MSETVTEYLDRIRQKDLAKDPETPIPGWRSTRAIAEYFGMNMARMRHDLDALYQDDQIGCCQEQHGALIEWFALPPAEV